MDIHLDHFLDFFSMAASTRDHLESSSWKSFCLFRLRKSGNKGMLLSLENLFPGSSLSSWKHCFNDMFKLQLVRLYPDLRLKISFWYNSSCFFFSFFLLAGSSFFTLYTISFLFNKILCCKGFPYSFPGKKGMLIKTQQKRKLRFMQSY
jgi:hypothetical protein